MADRYNTPPQGATDWHIPLNENFTNLDEDVEIRDVEANLGNYAPATDAKFVATDTGSVYIADGSSWSQLGTIDDASGGSGTGFINVLDEGAAGDGSTDDSAAIQTAVDQAVNTGGVVLFPGGNSYRIDSKIVIDGAVNITLKGHGAEIVGLPPKVFTVENSGKVQAEGFRYNPDDSTGTRTQFMSAYNNSDVRLYNIDCVGRGALLTCPFSSKLTSDAEAASYRVTVRDCTVEYDADTSTIENGINLYNVKNQLIDGYYYDQLTAEDGDGIKINAPGGDPTEQVVIANSEILNANDDAIDFYGSRAERVTVENCKLANSGTRGIKGRRGNRITIRSCEFDNNDLFFQETTEKIVVEDCIFRNIGGTRCLQTDDCPHAVVRDCEWTSSTVERPIETEQSSGDQRLVVDACHFEVNNSTERCVAFRCLGGTSEVKLVNNHTVSGGGESFFETFDDATLYLWANNNSIENVNTAFKSNNETGEYFIQHNRYEGVGTQISLPNLTDKTGST